jgi:hypothetical protein
VTAERRLREDHLTVEGDLEASLRGGDQLNRLDDRRPALEEFVRQTDGVRDVVSGDAELDLKPVPRIDHWRSVSVRGSMELGPYLNAHAFLRVERPPTLWEADADDEPVLRVLGEMIAAALARGAGARYAYTRQENAVGSVTVFLPRLPT